MADKAKILAEIDRLRKNLPWGGSAAQLSFECNCKNEAYTEIEKFINSLPEEHVSPCVECASISEGCKEICYDYNKWVRDNHKEEPVSNSDWLTELQEKLDNATPEQLEELWNKYNGVDEKEPVSKDLEEAAIEICSKILKGETVVIDGYEYVVLSDAEECFKVGAKWQQERIEETLLSEILPLFMHGGEADEVIAKLEEVLYYKEKED